MRIIEKLPKAIAAVGSVGLLAMAAQPVWAAKPGSSGPGGHTSINEVWVDVESDTILIIGEDFLPDPDNELVITLGDVDGVFGDITDDCVPDTSDVPEISAQKQ
jgi:hypothetical protein